VIISSWPRLVIGALVLMISAATGFVAWSVVTCAGGSAGPLWLGAVVLFGNVLAWWLLGRRVPSKPVLTVAFLPALAALSYTMSTIQLLFGHLAKGLSACSVIKAGQDFAPDGSEFLFIVFWVLACASFWGGLIPVVARAIRVHGGTSGNE
jgi:hypothetical protein